MAADRTPDEKGVNHVTSAELLNGTFTPVPSNREAVVLSAKALHAATDEKVGARNSSSDAASLQTAHDIMVGLGATCSMTGADSGEPAKAHPRASSSRLRGSLEETQDRVADALNDAYGADAYVWLRATCPPSSARACTRSTTDGRVRDLPGVLHRRRLRGHPDR
jgi:hypothetical protein